jgi:hypothetical protein
LSEYQLTSVLLWEHVLLLLVHVQRWLLLLLHGILRTNLVAAGHSLHAHHVRLWHATNFLREVLGLLLLLGVATESTALHYRTAWQREIHNASAKNDKNKIFSKRVT